MARLSLCGGGSFLGISTAARSLAVERFDFRTREHLLRDRARAVRASVVVPGLAAPNPPVHSQKQKLSQNQKTESKAKAGSETRPVFTAWGAGCGL